MEIENLLRSQANQMFEAIRDAGWEPSEFEWQDTAGHYSGNQVSALVHKSSGYYFTFDNVVDFRSRWSPGLQTLEDDGASGEWSAQIIMFGNWLTYLRREIDSPDCGEPSQVELKSSNPLGHPTHRTRPLAPKTKHTYSTA